MLVRWKPASRSDVARVGGASLAVGGALAAAIGSKWALAPFFAIAAGASVRWLQLTFVEQPPSVAEWEELEKRFGLIEVEVDGDLVTDSATGEQTWHLSPNTSGSRVRPEHADAGQRDLRRFSAEASRGGRLLLRMRDGRPTYRVGQGYTDGDHWLSAISVHVPHSSQLEGSGTWAGRAFKSVRFSRLVHASKLLCAGMASLAD